MGVPKFFRYISERYPCLSESVKEYQIPTFDNLYLDMNGIIHMCSHPDDSNPHFRISEEKLFADIFHYIEVLFRMIKPQKVFFMAVDGVAPRAKMNQQRGRRFRSAREALKMEEEARKKGEVLPDVPRFDSNCITPGTEFMAKLHEQLKYFVVKKVSTDNLWKNCKVILSGHETPGEGEHKIMDYIRYIRAQPGYDPNTRHCLYGLDADLIMLGLCTHDPHFSLLREEVKFGKKSSSRTCVPEEIRFYLLHLSLMREYLELEFFPLKDKLKEIGKFEYDIEKIIDDWVLMGFLVGNDFIPNLPNLHIVNGALPKLYKAYMDILPTLDGYINEAGTLNLERFEKFMGELANMDLEHYEETMDNLTYMAMKTGRKQVAHLPVSTKYGNNTKSDTAKVETKLIPFFDDDENEEPESDKALEDDCDNASSMDPALAALIKDTEEMYVEDDSTSDEEAAFLKEFKCFKDEYYRNKLEYQNVTPEVMRSQAEGYVTAIQWNLNYYYNGCCSWSWYYPHHYAPYISDIKGFSNLKIEFELGQPFKPYEQLLAVLPSASKNLLPSCYHSLMTDDNSLIKQYYPENFQTDLNGKRQEWEAVVLVPFIDEKVLLEAMKPCNEKLTPEEAKRNTHGPMLVYQYSTDSLGFYKAPSYFNTVENHALCTPIFIEDLRIPPEKLIKGAYPGVKFDVFYPGFPTMKHLKYTGELKIAKVKVFEQPSRGENMILTILQEKENSNEIPLDILGKTIFVDWPHLIEAQVVAISSDDEKYVWNENVPLNYDIEKLDPKRFASDAESVHQKALLGRGINFGKTKALVHVKKIVGRRYLVTPNGKVSLEKQFCCNSVDFPLQSIVRNIKVHDDFSSGFRDITDVYPVGATCFTLSNPHYGSQGTIMDSSKTIPHGKLTVSLKIIPEPDLSKLKDFEHKTSSRYFNLYQAAQQTGISNYVFSRVTGTLFIITLNNCGELKSANIGLDLKFNKKNQEIPGYTKKIGNLWHYSYEAIEIVKTYIKNYPVIFEFLGRNKDIDDLNANQLFGDDGPEKVKEIQTWLKTLPVHNIKPRSCNSPFLDADTIKEIEENVDKFYATQQHKTIEMQIKPHLLFKPLAQMGNICPDPQAHTKLFDRIVNVREGFTVPLGLKGTVTAVYKSSNASNFDDDMYEIVFDSPFQGGMVLNCSENRGYRLHRTAFINISHGQRDMEQKTGKPGFMRSQGRNNHQNSNNFQMNPVAIQQRNHPSNSAFAPVNMMQPMSMPSGNLYFKPQQQQMWSPRIHSAPADKRNFVPPQPPKSKVDIDTDCLKKLLQIDSNNTQQKNNSNPQTTFTNPNIPQSIMPHFMGMNAATPGGFNAPAAATAKTNFTTKDLFLNSNSCPTAKLLSYYQANGFGCPRYTYLAVQNGFIAQVISPTQKLITGKQAATREQASENAATAVIEMLQEMERQGHTPVKFPEPPQKWVQQNFSHSKQMNHQQQKNYQNTPRRNDRPENNRKNIQGKLNQPLQYQQQNQQPHRQASHQQQQQQQQRNSSKSTANSNFIPLQAIIKQGAKHSNSNHRNNPNTSQNNQNKSNEKKEAKTPHKDVNEGGQSSSQQKKAAAKARQTRIAANFIGNKP